MDLQLSGKTALVTGASSRVALLANLMEIRACCQSGKNSCGNFADELIASVRLRSTDVCCSKDDFCGSWSDEYFDHTGAADVLCRSNKLSQAVIVTILRASCCGHDPIMVPVARGSTDREESRIWPTGPAKTRAKNVGRRDGEHGSMAEKRTQAGF